MITSNPDPDKPLTWNVPEWFAMSCYINSALWGLLYNSSFTKVIQDVDTSILVENVVYLADTTKTNCSPAVFDNLKQSLLDYQKGILDSSVKMKPKLEEIRQIFKTCSSDKTTDWNSEVGDPSIVVNIIDELFSPKSVPLNLDNFVTYQETVNQIVSSSSKVKDDQLKLLKKFNEEGTKPKINKTFYKKIATIKISKNENGDLPKITNKTNSSGKEEIIVEQISNNIESTFATINNAGRKIDDDPFLKDIDYDERKTVKETVTDASGQTTKIPKEYVYVNTKSETISTYTLNNNSGGIIIEYSQEQSNKQGNGLVSNEEMWEILDNNIQEKYYQIGKYVLSAFVCWTSSGHYTCYFRFKDEWFVMNDYPKPGTIIKIDFTEPKDKKTFQHKLFRNSILFFYELDTNLIETDTKYCSVEFNYDINVERAELASAPKSTTTSSAQRTTLPKGQTTTPKGQTTTPKKTVQTVDKCEKYGEEWLNLFIAENAAPGSSVEYVENPDGTKTARVKDKKTGIVTSFVAADENCTFVQSNGLTKSATQSTAQSQSQSTASANQPQSTAASANQPQSTALQSQTQSQSKQATSKTAVAPQVDPLIGEFYVNNDNSRVIQIKPTDVKYVKKEKITTYKTEQEAINAQSAKKAILDKAEDEKKKVAAAAAQAKANAKALLATDEKTKANAALVAAKSKYAGNNEIIQELNKISDVDKIYPDFKITLKNLSFGTVVYNSNDNELYMVVNADIVSKNSKTKSKKFLNLVTDNICNADFKIFTLPDKTKPTYTLTGGTRRKGKKNLRKTNKIRNGKRTKKHIRDKNKLKTNKLRRTRKRNLNKRKTRKVL